MRKETPIVLAPTQESYREVLQIADNLYRQDPDWVTFFREVLGIDGIVRKRFLSFETLSRFEQSDEFDRIQRMLVKLREKKNASDTENEPTRVITVRLPKSMHEYLRTEAHDLRTSMNKLCISKLLQVIGEEMIPNERTNASDATPQPRPATSQTLQPQFSGQSGQGFGHTAPGLQHAPSQATTLPYKPTQPRF
jgi:predicted HicB family RNase H-like nuclease